VLTKEQINYYFDHPVEFFEDILQVIPTKQQKEVAKLFVEGIKNKKYITVKAGHLVWSWKNFYRMLYNNMVFINKI